MTDNQTTELQSLSKLKMAGKLHYWRGTIEMPEAELHAICDEIQVEHEQAIAATLGSGTCKNIAPDYLDFLCNRCGFVHYHSDENDTGDGNDWNYCPQCGNAVEQ